MLNIRLAPLRNVVGKTEISGDDAPGAVQRAGTLEHPAILPIMSPQSELNLEDAQLRNCKLVGPHVIITVGGMDCLDPALVALLFEFPPRKGERKAIHVDAPPLQIVDPDRCRKLIEQDPVEDDLSCARHGS